MQWLRQLQSADSCLGRMLRTRQSHTAEPDAITTAFGPVVAAFGANRVPSGLARGYWTLVWALGGFSAAIEPFETVMGTTCGRTVQALSPGRQPSQMSRLGGRRSRRIHLTSSRPAGLRSCGGDLVEGGVVLDPLGGQHRLAGAHLDRAADAARREGDVYLPACGGWSPPAKWRRVSPRSRWRWCSPG
jgi:hypothetical protein